MPNFVKATLTFSHNPDNEMIDTGERTMFGDPVRKRAQKYIEANQIFDLDSMDADTAAWLADISAFEPLDEREALSWARLSDEARDAFNNGVLPQPTLNPSEEIHT